MRAVLTYAAAAGGVVVLGGMAAAGLLSSAAEGGVWWAAGVAYGVQVAAFAVMVGLRHRSAGFLAAWAGGMLVRLGVVLGVGIWVARSEAYPPAPLLVSLAGFLFLLVLLEPVFLRMGMRSR